MKNRLSSWPLFSSIFDCSAGKWGETKGGGAIGDWTWGHSVPMSPSPVTCCWGMEEGPTCPYCDRLYCGWGLDDGTGEEERDGDEDEEEACLLGMWPPRLYWQVGRLCEYVKNYWHVLLTHNDVHDETYHFDGKTAKMFPWNDPLSSVYDVQFSTTKYTMNLIHFDMKHQWMRTIWVATGIKHHYINRIHSD